MAVVATCEGMILKKQIKFVYSWQEQQFYNTFENMKCLFVFVFETELTMQLVLSSFFPSLLLSLISSLPFSLRPSRVIWSM